LLFGLYALTASDPRPSDESWVPPLASCSAKLRRLVRQVGDESGELWLHLLGLALESPKGGAAEFVTFLGTVDAAEMRRHLIGVHVPAWRTAVGGDVLERAAAGDARAAAAILSDSCYYGGQAHNSLKQLLPLTAAQTKRRVLDVVRQFATEVFAPRERELTRQLRRAAAARKSQLDPGDPEKSITLITGGYVYEREPWHEQVILIPQLAAPPWLLLCEHRNGRIICYPGVGSVDAEGELRERALRVGRALSDEKRIEILRRLARSDASLTELVKETGLVKSTVHHHLAQLRSAGFITVSGHARGLTYALSRAGLTAGQAALQSLTEPL
jgi:DNA-binding transcriptional ArsR family regulator